MIFPTSSGGHRPEGDANGMNQRRNEYMATQPKRALSVSSVLKSVGWIVMVLLALMTFMVASRYLTLNPDVYFSEQRAVYIANTAGLLLHIVGAMLAILIGPFQFLPKIRKGRFLKWHRWLGRIYLVSVLIGGLAGLYMAPKAYGGLPTRLGFTLLALLWLASGAIAYKHIRNKAIQQHRQWMIRNYALTFAGVMLRLWQVAFHAAGLEFITGYIIAAWLAWIPNLIIAEWMIRRAKTIST
jgi:hypothetical protein